MMNQRQKLTGRGILSDLQIRLCSNLTELSLKLFPWLFQQYFYRIPQCIANRTACIADSVATYRTDRTGPYVTCLLQPATYLQPPASSHLPSSQATHQPPALHHLQPPPSSHPPALHNHQQVAGSRCPASLPSLQPPASSHLPPGTLQPPPATTRPPPATTSTKGWRQVAGVAVGLAVAGLVGFGMAYRCRTEPKLRNTGNTSTAKYRTRIGIDRTARLQP